MTPHSQVAVIMIELTDGSICLERSDIIGRFESLSAEDRKFVTQTAGMFVCRDGTQPDGSWGSVKMNSTELRDLAAWLITNHRVHTPQ
jgi:hypothetical protein